MEAFDLSGKTILVTGASSGLGRQTAISASQAGATVVLTGRDETRLSQTMEMLSGSGHMIIKADLTIQADIDRLVSEIPVLNGFVYSTGISELKPARFITRETISTIFSVSFDACVLLIAGILAKKKLSRETSSIVIISSISTRYPFAGGAMYISAKAALEGYARVLALELAPRGTRVNCVAPAFVKTPMLDQTARDYSDEAVRMIEKQQLLGLGEPEDVANTIVFYLSDASRWISATNLILGGG